MVTKSSWTCIKIVEGSASAFIPRPQRVYRGSYDGWDDAIHKDRLDVLLEALVNCHLIVYYVNKDNSLVNLSYYISNVHKWAKALKLQIKKPVKMIAVSSGDKSEDKVI